MIRPSGRHVIDAEDEPERSRRPHSGRHDPGDDGPGGDTLIVLEALLSPWLTESPHWFMQHGQASKAVAVLSEPQEVNTTSAARRAPISAATWSLARCTARAASRPAGWVAEGFAPGRESQGSMASTTSSEAAVVALQSKCRFMGRGSPGEMHHWTRRGARDGAVSGSARSGFGAAHFAA